jgi:FkbM family methyltransferase
VVFEEVFFQEHCKFDVECEEAGLIVDAGAHAGLTTVFFALRYPRATIVALEPEPSNFELLRANTAPFPSVRPLNAALWHEPARLSLANPESDTWTFRFEPARSTAGAGGEAGAASVEAITMDALLAQYGTRRMALLKMNIEGAEAEVLAASGNWLHRVDNLAVELHDWLRPGCAEALDAACPPERYRRSRSGEFTVLTRVPDRPRP